MSFDLPSADCGDEDPVNELMAAGLMFEVDLVSLRGSRTEIVFESAPLKVSSSASVTTTRLANTVPMTSMDCNKC